MATVSSTIFRSFATKMVTLPLAEAINWWKIPKHNLSTKEEQAYRGWLLLSIIKNAQDMDELLSPEDAIAYILTGTEIAFPGTIAQFERDKIGVFTANEFPHNPRDVMTALREITEGHENQPPAQPSSGEEGTSGESGDHPEPSESSEPPLVDVGFGDVILDPELLIAGIMAAVGRWGVEMYPIGKNVTAANLEGFRGNRIAAVQRFLMTDSTNAAFREDLLPKLDVLRSIERAFNQYTNIRLQLGTIWARLKTQGSTNRVSLSFMVTIALCDGYGLGAPTFIADLLVAYPQLKDFPELAPAIKSYLEALEIFSREDPELRGFVKVRYGSRYKLFANTSSRGALLATAVAFKRQSEASAGRFIDITPFADTISRVNQFLSGKNLPIISDVGTGSVTVAPTVS